ncbi:D-amino acid dehydrogenase [Actibacterium sp. 188UL27-1]|uniref:D-amino acid dehydrogenase n=1 Tax=Actibacterium sp. 188UL27-1 TaxID=2786961 RepID=UPI00195CAD5F|nr:D-amino acid dehydrogenase [Actibacterium sp. 188UL27-1]MBM7068950.1 D-amino acid dehydrogenase [Actibacterium sp. 188UL27-1]
MPHIAVLGAGITGVTTAFHLHQRGFDVTVYDRQRYPAMETSFANGGQLSASNAEVWTTLGTVLKGLKWMLQAEAPLLVNPRPSWHKVSWMAQFLGNIPNYRRNTIKSARLAIAARPFLSEMADRAGVDFDLEKRGILHVYREVGALHHARKVTGLLAEAGLHRQELTGDEVRARDAALTGPFVGGFWTESDMTGDIHKFTVGVARWLERQGVVLRLGHEITDLRRGGDQVHVNDQAFDGIVVCAGVASRWMARALGDHVNIYPVKGYSITVNLNDQTSQGAAPWVSLLDDEAKIVTSRLGPDRLRIAGTAEFNGENRDIRADRIAPLVRWSETMFPDVSTQDVTPWAGLRPMMPSMMPKVGRGRHPQVFYNTGHGHLGWTLSGATADMIGHVVAGAYRPTAQPVTMGTSRPA